MAELAKSRLRGIMCAMTEHERDEFVRRVSAGDADALQHLIVYYHATLRSTVARNVAKTLTRRVDPDDVLQQAYITAFKAAANTRFDGPGHFFKWLEQIARNRLKDVQRSLRRQKRDIARETHDDPGWTASFPDLVHRLASDDTSPSRRIARDEAVAAVMTCLARLSDNQRDVVRLRIIEDVPVPEIARTLGKTEVAVYALFRRGLKRLNDLLGPITRFITRP